MIRYVVRWSHPSSVPAFLIDFHSRQACEQASYRIRFLNFCSVDIRLSSVRRVPLGTINSFLLLFQSFHSWQPVDNTNMTTLVTTAYSTIYNPIHQRYLFAI